MYSAQFGISPSPSALEKLEAASKHPDLGPVGDGLITLMDQKLSKLDDRLYELSSKISTGNVSVPEFKKEPKPEIVKNEERQESEIQIKPKKKTFTFENPPAKNLNQLLFLQQNHDSHLK